MTFEGKTYTIVDVDCNGICHIDKSSAYNKTSAVFSPFEADVVLVKKRKIKAYKTKKTKENKNESISKRRRR